MNLERSIKNSAVVLFPGTLLLFFTYGNYWSSHWYSKWSLVVAIFCFFYSFFIANKTSLFFLPVLLTSLLSACWVALFIGNQYKDTADLAMMASLHNGAMYSLICIVMATLLMAFLPKTLAGSVELYMALVSFLSASYMILESGKIAYLRGAFSGNAGMSACLVAFLMPFIAKAHKYASYVAFVLCGSACALSHSSIGMGTFIVVSALYIMRTHKVSFFRTVSVASVFSIPLIYALKYEPIIWLSSSGRMPVWRSIFSWWNTNSSAFFGAGIGTGMSLFPTIQNAYHTTGAGYYLWLHSDWMQVLFEMGLVGLFSVSVAFLFLCFRSWNTPHLFSSLIGAATCSVADYPIRLPIHCTCMTLLAWLILQNKNDSLEGINI